MFKCDFKFAIYIDYVIGGRMFFEVDPEIWVINPNNGGQYATCPPSIFIKNQEAL